MTISRYPGGVIQLQRRGLWRPWRWTYIEICPGREGPQRSEPVTGRAWTRATAMSHARICSALRTGSRWST